MITDDQLKHISVDSVIMIAHPMLVRGNLSIQLFILVLGILWDNDLCSFEKAAGLSKYNIEAN